jgi:hypothetical protein
MMYESAVCKKVECTKVEDSLYTGIHYSSIKVSIAY